MYVVDITRVNKKNFESDMLVGNLTTDTKIKIINYIKNYALVNLKIDIDSEPLDRELNMNLFFLKSFIKNNYGIDVNDDIIVQSLSANKNNCVFLKLSNYKKDSYPYIYQFSKDKIDSANCYMAYLINDSLISSLSENGKLNEYESPKIDLNSFNKAFYRYDDSCFEIVSLYENGNFIEDLLNNSVSYNQLKKSNFYIKI